MKGEDVAQIEERIRPHLHISKHVNYLGLSHLYSGPTTTIAKPPTTNAKTTMRMRSICTRCGTEKLSGELSCCASGGSWYNKCGDTGDANFDHTWSEGIEACVTNPEKCIAGLSKCVVKHNDFEAIENKLTNPIAMDKDENGNLQGNCATAILNHVEGELCCTDGMKQLAACVPIEVGDYTLCKNIWNTAYGPTFYDKAAAIMVAFKNDGYCTSSLSSVCAKCAAHRTTGVPNCCASGGAWHLNCGPGQAHSWLEGSLACKHKGSHVCSSF